MFVLCLVFGNDIGARCATALIIRRAVATRYTRKKTLQQGYYEVLEEGDHRW